MPPNFLSEKLRLREYLEIKGIKHKNKYWQCINPGKHSNNDEHYSATLYENPDGGIFYCPVCSESWDIFAVAGILENHINFKNQLKSVRSALNISEPEPIQKKTKPKKKKKPQLFPTDEKQKKLIQSKIKSLAKEKEWGEIKGRWRYHDKNNNVIALDVRFEKENESKNIITFWYDDQLKWYDAPIFIYGQDRLNPDKKNIIHEGSKCADIGKKI